MALSRWKTVAGLLILVGAIGLGSGLSMGRPPADSTAVAPIAFPEGPGDHPEQADGHPDCRRATSWLAT